jgi:hypothetical protein
MDFNQPVRRRESRAIPLLQGEPLDTFARHRVCKHDGCTARLSRYNPSDRCGEHRGWREQPQTRTRRRRT